MRYLLLLSVALFFGSQSLLAQPEEANDHSLILQNATPVDNDRYEGIKGDPYLFKSFQKGVVVTNNMRQIKDILINYNGFSKEFEARNGNKSIELEKGYYMQVLISDPKTGDTLQFQRGVDLRDPTEFRILVHMGPKSVAFKEFRVEEHENIHQEPGRTVRFKRFVRHEVYFLVLEGKVDGVALKKKPILRALNNKQVDAFVKERGLKLTTEADLVTVLSYYDTL